MGGCIALRRPLQPHHSLLDIRPGARSVRIMRRFFCDSADSAPLFGRWSCIGSFAVDVGRTARLVFSYVKK
jgi:hypothetical protein